MANGVKFAQANAILGAPTREDAVAETVAALHVYRYRDLDNRPLVLSKWQLTPDELEEVKRTGAVWFTCWGDTHPPMWISGHDPFARANPEIVDA